MSVLAWVMAHAVRQIHGQSATIAWGDRLTALTRPCEPPDQVPLLTTDQGTAVLPEAIRVLDGALELAAGHGARLLVIASDGHLNDHDQHDAVRDLLARLDRAGCTVLQLCLDSAARVLPHARPVDASDPATAAQAIGQAAIDALRHA
ncbi:hypothetical protein AB0K60_13555 [Thermopolyspora sp. NPDC052614]|uniref:hypothetical protein n=1 Tax=Thermopolyspora sp. NPDC052614 TaxID=3155682 RepID=UPI00343BE574